MEREFPMSGRRSLRQLATLLTTAALPLIGSATSDGTEHRGPKTGLLCSDFGIEDSRGTLLRVVFGHRDLASLVGASRPRVTEHLAQFGARTSGVSPGTATHCKCCSA